MQFWISMSTVWNRNISKVTRSYGNNKVCILQARGWIIFNLLGFFLHSPSSKSCMSITIPKPQYLLWTYHGQDFTYDFNYSQVCWLFHILVKFNWIHNWSKSELIPPNHQNYDIMGNKFIYTKTILEFWIYPLKKEKGKKNSPQHSQVSFRSQVSY